MKKIQLIATTLPGIEDIAIKEIKELTKSEAKKILEGKILIQAAAQKIQKMQNSKSIKQLYELKNFFKFKKEEEIYKKIGKTPLKIVDPFAVRCKREGRHPFNSQAIASKVGEIFHKKKHKVDLEKPNTTIYIEIMNDQCFLGINPSNDLGKRNYRIKHNNQSINAPLAYAMIRLANWKPKQALVDPFCKDGVIPIEAALFANQDKRLQILGFDDAQTNIRGASINAKIAKVYNKISLGSYSVSWLDTKFKKGKVDAVITAPPFTSATHKEEDVKKLYKELFHQLDYVLKKGGLFVAALPKAELLKSSNKSLKLKEERKVVVGGMAYSVIVFKKI
ncbi:N-6 DNA methylase [Candidatus Woesearchaeota archaeon]|nr:N-6 DNA methylase [Candidatus Woesearchaeota archaeon]